MPLVLKIPKTYCPKCDMRVLSVWSTEGVRLYARIEARKGGEWIYVGKVKGRHTVIQRQVGIFVIPQDRYGLDRHICSIDAELAKEAGIGREVTVWSKRLKTTKRVRVR